MMGTVEPERPEQALGEGAHGAGHPASGEVGQMVDTAHASAPGGVKAWAVVGRLDKDLDVSGRAVSVRRAGRRDASGRCGL